MKANQREMAFTSPIPHSAAVSILFAISELMGSLLERALQQLRARPWQLAEGYAPVPRACGSPSCFSHT